MTDYIIGVDLGGTRLRAALMDDDLAIHARHEVLTEAEGGFEATLGRMKQLIRAAMPPSDEPLLGIGVSVPGPTNPFKGVVELGTNLAGWHDIPLANLLQDEFGVPVFLGNDANVAALAEATRGAARGYRHIIFITVSTGIGSGIIVDGHLLLGKEGLAAEAGHIVMLLDGEFTTLEKQAAGPSLARQARERIQAGEASIMAGMVDGDLEKITGKTVGGAVLAGDTLANAIVSRAGTILGGGMASLLHIFNPEILVFGGGVSTIGEPLFQPMRAAIEANCIDKAYWRNLKIEPAALGENVSLIGAGALVMTRGGVEDLSAVKTALDA
ncbi:MAG: ROK family protein [Chloroflexi bacterium OLB15]|nr:MAG: ROK family protein [Chloroflexi bacterium OLB15]